MAHGTAGRCGPAHISRMLRVRPTSGAHSITPQSQALCSQVLKRDQRLNRFCMRWLATDPAPTPTLTPRVKPMLPSAPR